MSEKKGRITKLLKDSFDGVYCDTCEYNDSRRCDECHRKAMNWGISDNFAEKLADAIMAITKEDK